MCVCARALVFAYIENLRDLAISAISAISNISLAQEAAPEVRGWLVGEGADQARRVPEAGIAACVCVCVRARACVCERERERESERRRERETEGEGEEGREGTYGGGGVASEG